MKIIKSSAISGEVSVSDVIAELRRGSRVLLLLRHSERPRIGYEDKTFGASLPLTENGKRLCVEFGRMLAGATPSVEFRASPLLRTVMTAELVAEGMGLAGAEVVRDALVGNGSAYVASELEVWRLFRDGSFFRRMVEYMQAGEQRGFNPLAPATDAAQQIVEQSKAQLAQTLVQRLPSFQFAVMISPRLMADRKGPSDETT